MNQNRHSGFPAGEDRNPPDTGMSACFRGRGYCVSFVHCRGSGNWGVTPQERCDEKRLRCDEKGTEWQNVLADGGKLFYTLSCRLFQPREPATDRMLIFT